MIKVICHWRRCPNSCHSSDGCRFNTKCIFKDIGRITPS